MFEISFSVLTILGDCIGAYKRENSVVDFIGCFYWFLLNVTYACNNDKFQIFFFN